MMPADHKVSVAWQIVFTFISILNLWAFYRIRKLIRYFLYVVLPSIAYSIVFLVVMNSEFFGGFIGSLDWKGYGYALSVGPDSSSTIERESYWSTSLSQVLLYGSYLVNGGVQAFAIYLVIIWSRQHNKQFDQPSAQPQPL